MLISQPLGEIPEPRRAPGQQPLPDDDMLDAFFSRIHGLCTRKIFRVRKAARTRGDIGFVLHAPSISVRALG